MLKDDIKYIDSLISDLPTFKSAREAFGHIKNELVKNLKDSARSKCDTCKKRNQKCNNGSCTIQCKGYIETDNINILLG